ncbi:ubiquitin carboxyl-terminal hydrolase 16 [Arachis duranensis]|uniref:ubiquitinyl hydrolase 1 n=1 Tax=Arachis duranensis TaxID=130453 RepID=A0A6P4BAU8_ARADU|nr:ubiquitin carboxyl-terminal hydrolase 16 [Arachis duranensis]
MRYTGNLGFSSLVLLVLLLLLICLVFPAIGFFYVRRKWRISVARKEEIRRLLILAAEETARAEREATYGYGAAAETAVKSNQCAVCYVPATARCAQCKSVRYCSFECQTLHWRQGHKLECRLQRILRQSDVVSDLGNKVTEQEFSRIADQKSEIAGAEHEASGENQQTSVAGVSSKVLYGKNENVRDECLAGGTITDSNSELSSNSFSGFSASPSASESSDDSSICESVISNEHDQSDGPVFVDSTLDIPDSTSSDGSMVVAMSSSPKFASLVESVDGFSTMRKLNGSRSGPCKEEGKLAKNGTSGSGMLKGATIKPSIVSSGFWDRTLGTTGIEEDANSDTSPSHSDESTHNTGSDSQSFRFSFSSIALMQAQDSEAKDFVSDNPSPNTVGDNVPCSGSASTENDRDTVNSSKATNLKFMNSKDSILPNPAAAPVYESDQLGSKGSSVQPLSCLYPPSPSLSKGSGCEDSLNVHNLQSYISMASNRVVGNHGINSKSAEIRCLTRDLDSNLVRRTDAHSNSSTKHVNNGNQSATSTSSGGVSCSANSKSGLKSSVLKVVDQFRGSNFSKQFPLVWNDTAGKQSDKGLFPYELFVKIYNSNKGEFSPFGLINCGNSCYANAVLQCLVFTPPLTAYFLQGLHSKACANKKCFNCEFESLILKSKDTKYPLSPKGILSQLRRTGSQLGNGKEEDAHEFLRHAIDTMQSVCLMDTGVDVCGSLEEDTTLIGLTFGGYLRSKIKCMKCGGKSEHQERMMDLTVEIEGDIATLQEALRRFTSTESLDGENKYHCVRCKSYEKAKKKLTISEAPNVLTIALKRFQSGKFGKLNKPIQFPKTLDLAPFMSGTSDKSPIYRLYGVVVHLDIMNAAFSGHYVSYVKNSQNKWFKVDDSVVTPVEVERVLTKGSYMLFYARCSPKAPRSIRGKTLSPESKGKVTGKTATKTRNGSCSTDSTHDSTTTDEFSNYIFGDSRVGWGSPWRNSESDTSSSTSSSSSPLNFRHSPLADMDRYDSVSPGLSADIDGNLYRNKMGHAERKGGVVPLSHSDTLHHRKLESTRISSNSNFRDTNSHQRLGSNHFNGISSGAPCRKPRDRTD